ATPPNAIVYSSKMLTVKNMMRYGILMNIITLIVITLFIQLYFGA
ncbi:MAG: anion permease, partial [Bacteroidota bacterium]